MPNSKMERKKDAGLTRDDLEMTMHLIVLRFSSHRDHFFFEALATLL